MGAITFGNLLKLWFLNHGYIFKNLVPEALSRLTELNPGLQISLKIAYLTTPFANPTDVSALAPPEENSSSPPNVIPKCPFKACSYWGHSSGLKSTGIHLDAHSNNKLPPLFFQTSCPKNGLIYTCTLKIPNYIYFSPSPPPASKSKSQPPHF